MAKAKITTKTCPLCGYVYERMQKYEMVEEEVSNISLHFSSHNFKHIPKKKLVEKCTENSVIKGDEDFEYVYHENDPMNERFGGDPIEIDNDCVGMFCPKCGIFLNDNICTKYVEKEI